MVDVVEVLDQVYLYFYIYLDIRLYGIGIIYLVP